MRLRGLDIFFHAPYNIYIRHEPKIWIQRGGTDMDADSNGANPGGRPRSSIFTACGTSGCCTGRAVVLLPQ